MAWQEQYDRVMRWLDRIENHPRLIADKSGEYEDYLWAYFQNCWHLKDWIQKDAAIDARKKAAIKDLVDKGLWKQGDALKVCSDLANGTKHFELNNPRLNATAKNRSFTMHVGSEEPDTWDFIVSYDGGRREDALTAARKAKAEWDDIILAVGL